jgi:3-oxoacyl-[acyl-carrier protein] reductase
LRADRRDVHRELGRLDILVNNDGAPPLGALDSFDDARMVESGRAEPDERRAAHPSRGAALRAAGGGAIVNITALSVLQPIPRFGLSVATWAGVLGYAKTLSLEVAADRITVNTLCPGASPRPARQGVRHGSGGAPVDDAALAEMAKEIPMKRRRNAGRDRGTRRVPGVAVGRVHHGLGVPRRRRPRLGLT